MQKAAVLRNDTTENYNNEFKSLARTAAELIEKSGRAMVPYHSEDLHHYSQLNDERKQSTLTQLGFYIATLEHTLSQREVGEKQSLWGILQMLKMHPTADIFDKASSEYAIEVYDHQGIQLWRNLRFMDVCSYSIEEMFSLTWQERYDRDETAVQQTVQAVQDIFTGKTNKTTPVQIFNKIIEKQSSQQFIIDVFHEYISPLYNEYKTVTGFIVVSSVKLVGSNKEAGHRVPAQVIEFPL